MGRNPNLQNHTYIYVKGYYVDLSLRARAYLWSCSIANTIMGGLLIASPQNFQAASFDAMRAATPLRAWGLIFLVGALMTCWGAVRGTERPARWALMANLLPTGGFFAGFLVAVIQGTSSGPSGCVAWGLLTIINFIMLANPLRTPFEDMLKEIAESRE